MGALDDMGVLDVETLLAEWSVALPVEDSGVDVPEVGVPDALPAELTLLEP